MAGEFFAGKKVWVAGHRGMVGSAICRRLEQEPCEVITVTRDQCDLRDRGAVRAYLDQERPHMIIDAAARVGGIYANDSYPVDFLLENLEIQNNVISAAHDFGVEKLLFLGSSCIYPKLARQPMTEDQLLTGPLEPTNEWYALAKIAGIKLCEAYRKQYGSNFISVMPTNLYGPNDNFDPMTSHVLPALLRKAVDRKEAGQRGITLWGSGTPLREFLHVDDLADACIFLMEHYNEASHVNVGSGSEISIADMARTVMRIVGLEGELEFDRTKPDGTPRKLMSSQRLRDMGWVPRIELEDGLRSTLAWYLEHVQR